MTSSRTTKATTVNCHHRKEQANHVICRIPCEGCRRNCLHCDVFMLKVMGEGWRLIQLWSIGGGASLWVIVGAHFEGGSQERFDHLSSGSA